jgi:regulator of protease activity HflC (stomatin/prohibitin superfamily)
MSLRDRQIGGLAISKKSAFFLTIAGTLCSVLMFYVVWSPLLGIPEDFEIYIVMAGAMLYVSQCLGRVEQGKERAQLFFGKYTGVSFPAGIYLLPRLPFPIITLVIVLFVQIVENGEEKSISDYFGWTLEGDVSIQTIAIPLDSSGLSSDGIRLNLKGSLLFEITSPAVVLSQNGTGANEESFRKAIQDEVSSRVKRFVIAASTAKKLYSGAEGDSRVVAESVSEACDLSVQFGVSLSKMSLVDVTIVDERIRKMFDTDNSRELIRRNTLEAALAFAEFKKSMPKDISEEILFSMFVRERYPDGNAPIDFNVFKFK